MSKKKIIILVIAIILLLVLIPLIVYAQKVHLNYDENGKPIVFAGQKKPDEIKEGTEYTLAIPTEEKTETEEDMKKEKENSYSESNYEINSSNNDEIDKYSDDERKKEEEFLIVFKKYYGDKETEKLLAEIRKETENTNDNSSTYKFPEKGKELIKEILNIIDTKNPTEEEKKSLMYVIDSIDLTTLNDSELVNRIQSR